MATDITLRWEPDTHARAAEALERASIDIEGALAVVAGPEPALHICVRDRIGARAALARAGLRILDENEAIVLGGRIGTEGSPEAVLDHLRASGVEILAYPGTGDRSVFVTADPQSVLPLLP